MTTHKDIWNLICSELSGGERVGVLQPLAAAFIDAYDDEVDDEERDLDHEVLADDAAHSYYCDQYDRGGDGSEPVSDTDMELSQKREVSVPSWLPTNHRRLLRYLARDERRRDDAVASALRREYSRRAPGVSR